MIESLFEKTIKNEISPGKVLNLLEKYRKFILEENFFSYNRMVLSVKLILDNTYVEQDKYENILIILNDWLKNNRNKNIKKELDYLNDKNRTLGIQKHYTEIHVMKYMNNIRNDWSKRFYKLEDSHFFKKLTVQNPKELMKRKIGICWSQVELERYLFLNTSFDTKTFFLCYYDNDKFPSHTFLTFEKNNRFYWFEHAWETYIGIHEYPTLIDLFNDVKNKFVRAILNDDYDIKNLKLFEYEKPKYGINREQFFYHCRNGKIINMD